jgi:hypothetical protein
MMLSSFEILSDGKVNIVLYLAQTDRYVRRVCRNKEEAVDYMKELGLHRLAERLEKELN